MKYSRPDTSDRSIKRVTSNLYDSTNQLYSKIQSVNNMMSSLRNDVENLKKLTKIKWKDLRFPICNLYPVAASGNPLISTTVDQWLGTLLFQSGVVNRIHITAQMPHDWKEGTAIRPHVHWAKTVYDTGDVYWSYSIYSAEPGGQFTSLASGGSSEEATSSGAILLEPDYHFITKLPEVNMEGKNINTMLLILLSRDGTNPNDTYGREARLIEFGIHYQIDDKGATTEYTK